MKKESTIIGALLLSAGILGGTYLPLQRRVEPVPSAGRRRPVSAHGKEQA